MSDYKPKFPSKYYQPNQLTPELFGLHCLNPLFYTNSPSRNAMMASHWSQRLVIKNAEEPIIQSLVEADWANYTFAVRMPENGRIIKVIDQYPPGVARDSLSYNPLTAVIYEKDMGPSHPEDRELDIFFIPDHLSLHQYFGFEYKQNKDNINKLFVPGNFISKGTVFADTPAKNEDGAMMPGINLNTCLMSVPGVEEDGFVVCSDVLPRCAIDIFEKRSITFGSDQFPLNLLGTPTNYKAFPDIGEDVRPDGLLMMLRKYNKEAAPALMSVHDVSEPDFYFDQGLYARGGSVPIEQLEKKYMENLDKPNRHFKQSLGRVVGIKVIINNSTNKQLPDLMWPQINKYANAYKNYQKELLDVYNNLKAERKRKYGTDEMRLSPKLTTALEHAMSVLDVERKKFSHSINLSHRTNPIDEVHIEFTIKYRIIPTDGFKFSDYSGG